MARSLRPLFIGTLLLSGISLGAATFTSVASGNWGATTTWSVSGVDPDGIPDSNDDVTIANGNTVTDNVSNCYSRSLTINAGCTLVLNNKIQRIYGDLSNSGTISGVGSVVFYGNGFNITSSSQLNNGGNWTFITGSDYTISVGTIISKNNYFIINSGASVSNRGAVYLNAGSITLHGSWTNLSGSSLSVARNFSGNGTLNCSAATNSVTFTSIYTTQLRCVNSTYYNLVLNAPAPATKTMNGDLTVLNNLNINGSTTLDCGGFDITIGRHWLNNAGTDCMNMALVTLNGTVAQTISRGGGGEIFNDLEIAGSGTVTLATDITINDDFTITSGAFDVSASNEPVRVLGDFINNGTFTARQGTVTFAGSAGQTVGGVSTTDFYNISSFNSSGGVNVTGFIRLTNVLTVGDGSFNTSGAGTVTLLATGATTYARIGDVATGSTLGGTGWIIQTYIDGPATAYWQFMSTAVNGMTLNDWDQDPRFYMSGVGGNDGNACCPTFRSVRTYSEATNTYSNITSVSHVLVNGRGYMIWMGDNLNTLTAPLIFDSRGTPNFGNVSRAVTAGGAGGGYNLVGNPYTCPIDFSDVRTASTASLGVDFLVLDESGAYQTSPNAGVIGPNQGFMVLTSTSANVNFTEACKNTTATPDIIRTGTRENELHIRSSNAVNGLGGEAVVRISSDATAGYEMDFDLPFLPSPYDDATNIWTTATNAQDLLLNVTDGTSDELSIPLTVRSGTPGDQLLSFRGLNGFSAYSCAWLEDLATGEKIDLRNRDTYAYNAEYAGEERKFILHFGRTANECPLSEQGLTPSLEAMSQVYTSGGNIFAKFSFGENTDVQITVYNTAGQEVSAPKNVTVASETIALDSPDAHGVYFVRIIKGDELVTKKIYY